MIKLIRTLLLIGTFISATLAVVYPDVIGPLVTLGFTTASGVVDILDKVFVQGLRPENVKVFPMPNQRTSQL